MPRLVGLCVGILLLGLMASHSSGAQKKKIDELLKELESNNPQTRITACNEVGKLADVRLAYAKMALPALRNILAKDPDGKVRQAALAALGKTEAETKDYIANMLKYLKEDKDYGVQTTALNLLGDYGQEAAGAISPLKERLAELRNSNKEKDPGDIRSAILSALAQINQGLNVPLAIEALKEDKAASVKVGAVARIRQIAQQGGAKETAPVLIETYQASLKEGPSPALRRGILDALAAIEPKPKRYLTLLIETLKQDNDPAVTVAVIAALGRAGEDAKEAIPLVLEAQKASARAAPKDGSDPGGVRKTILESVVQMGVDPKQLVPLLVDTLKGDRDAGVRVVALAALANLGDKAQAAIPALIDLQKANAKAGFKDGNDPGELRVSTLKTLAKLNVPPKDLVPLLLDAAQRDRNPTVRLTAVRNLGDMGPAAKSALLVLQRMQKPRLKASEQEKQIAQAAVEAIAKIKGK